MDEKSEIRVKFEIGEIKFEAEGAADLVERERSIFNNTLLPAAIDAIVRTRGVVQSLPYIEVPELQQPMSSTSNEVLPESADLVSKMDLSCTTLASFIKKYGSLSELDFVLFSAYFDEKKNGTDYFTKENAVKYYDTARRTKPKNISMCLNRLAQKGLIIDATEVEQNSPKPYRISSEGLEYVRTYIPKEIKEKKPAMKPRKQRTKEKSRYADINSDELNLESYPSIRVLKNFKEKMMLVLYIITNEKKGEWFTTEDVLFLLTDIFGEAATKNQIEGIFRRKNMWFKKEKDGKIIKRKLLNQGVDFASSLVKNDLSVKTQ